MKRLIIILFLLVPLQGCSWIADYFAGDDNAEPPTELTPLKPAVELEQLWSVSTGDGSRDKLIQLVPAIDNGTIYVVSRNGVLQAYDVSSGEQKWSVETQQRISAGPSVKHGVILLGTRNASVMAFRQQDGQSIWVAPVSSEVLSIPAISQDKVIVRTGDGRLTALNASDGSKSWDYQSREPALTLRGTSRPLIAGDTVISAFDNGEMIALSLHSGRQNWRQQVAVPRGRSEIERIADLDADPVHSQDVVYVAAYQGNLAAVDINTGELLWKRELSSHDALAIDDDKLFVTDFSGQVWSIHRNNGASLWRQQKLMWRSLTAPAVQDQYVVVGDFEGYLHWLSQHDGALAARMRGDSNGYAVAPLVSQGILFALGKGGELSAFRIKQER